MPLLLLQPTKTPKDNVLANVINEKKSILENRALARLLREYAIRTEHVEFVYRAFLRGNAYKSIARHAEEVLTAASGSGKWVPTTQVVVGSVLTELERSGVLQSIPRDLCLVRSLVDMGKKVHGCLHHSHAYLPSQKSQVYEKLYVAEGKKVADHFFLGMVVGGCVKRIAHRIALAAAMEVHEERLAAAKAGASDVGDDGPPAEAAEALALRTNRLSMSTLLEDCAFASVQRTVEELTHEASTMLSMMPEHLAKYDFELGRTRPSTSSRHEDGSGNPSLSEKVQSIAETHFTSVSLARQIIRSLPQPPSAEEGEGCAEDYLHSFVVMPMTSVQQLCSAVQKMALDAIQVGDAGSGGGGGGGRRGGGGGGGRGGDEPAMQLSGTLVANVALMDALNELELLGALEWDSSSNSGLDLPSLRPLVWHLGRKEGLLGGNGLP